MAFGDRVFYNTAVPCCGLCHLSTVYFRCCVQANELLLCGRKITALQACQAGLLSQVFWPTNMMQEVIPRVQNLASQSAKVTVVPVVLHTFSQVLIVTCSATHLQPGNNCHL